MAKQPIPQSKQFVRLASPNRLFSVAAENDETLAEVRMFTHRSPPLLLES
jgi:hypothetical protein